MKITIAFLPEEYEQMRIIRAFLTSYLDNARTRMTTNHPPYFHTYITTPKKVQNTEKPED